MCFWAGCFGILGDELIFQGHCYISVGTALNGIANFKLQTGPQTAETHPQVALEVISNRCIFQFAMNQFVCQLQAVSIYVLHRWLVLQGSLDDHRHVCRRVFQLKKPRNCTDNSYNLQQNCFDIYLATDVLFIFLLQNQLCVVNTHPG